METREDSPISEEVEEAYDVEGDYRGDRSRDTPVNENLHHLTLSDLALKFLEKYPALAVLNPLVDQITATNYLDWNGAEYYKYYVDHMICTLQMGGFGETIEEYTAVDTIRAYLHQLIDGCKGGYRGRLATEIRRVYSRTPTQSPQKKRWPF